MVCNVEDEIEEWATKDPVLSKFGGLNSWRDYGLNQYDNSHARNDVEKVALKATDVIMKLAPKEFYYSHPCYSANEPRKLINYFECERHWMDDAVRFALGSVVEKRGKRTGRYELNPNEERRIRTAVNSKEKLHQRFRTFFYIYSNVLGKELDYHSNN